MKQRPFLALWTVAVVATVAAFVVHLALRGRTVDLGYKLGRARAEQARLREVKRVLSLEAASYETPQRVESVARTLLGMTPPPAERVIALRGFAPRAASDERREDAADGALAGGADAGAGLVGEPGRGSPNPSVTNADAGAP